MKHDDLRKITSLGDYDEWIKRGARSEVTLYTVIKEDVTAYYDYYEVDIDPLSGETITVVEERDQQISLHRGQILRLSVAALEELWLKGQVNDGLVIEAEAPPASEYRFNCSNRPITVNKDDVCIHLPDPAQEEVRGPRTSRPHILAIKAALNELGKKAENDKIYDWCRTHSDFPSKEHQAFLNLLDFEEEGIDPFSSTTNPKAIVMKSEDKPISKKTFQDACSRVRRKL